MRKLALSLLAVSSLVLASCYHAEDDLSPATIADVKFNIEVEGLTSQQITRAGSLPSLQAPEHVLVLDKHDGKTDSFEKTSLDGLTLSLSYGMHDLYFVAAPEAWSSYNAEALTVAWPNNGSMKAVWAYHYQLDVVEGTEFEDLVLPLAVAAVRIATLDKIPSTARKAAIEAPDVCSVLDLDKMQAATTQAGGFVRNITVAGVTTAFSTNIFTFVPAAGNVGDIKMAFYTDDNMTADLAEHTFETVPVAAGYVSNYTGYFFSEGLPIPVSYSSSWLGSNDYSY